MATIVSAPIKSIRANPHRDIKKYPFSEPKIEALLRSIADVGLWEGCIAREASGGHYELAFGHHRVEAARRAGMRSINLIVRDLTDEQMLQFMGRENMEDYNADFLVMLESWQAAEKYAARAHPEWTKSIEIARMLGWDRVSKTENTTKMTPTAQACAAASSLISGGYVAAEDLAGLSVKAAREILTRASQRIKQIDDLGSRQHRPAAEIERAKKHVGKAAKATAKQVKEDKVAPRDIGGAVDVHAYRNAKDAKPSPLFAVFGNAVAESIDRMLSKDTAAEKLAEIAAVAGKVTGDEDRACMRRLDFALLEMIQRGEAWRKRLVGGKVVPLKALKGGA